MPLMLVAIGVILVFGVGMIAFLSTKNNEAQDRDGRCKTQPWALCYPIGAGCSAPGSQ